MLSFKGDSLAAFVVAMLPNCSLIAVLVFPLVGGECGLDGLCKSNGVARAHTGPAPTSKMLLWLDRTPEAAFIGFCLVPGGLFKCE